MSDGDAGCTSRQRNAHVTESREILYRWHPWHGRTVFVLGAVTKADEAVFRCALEHADVARPLEVPQWMFDAATCCHISLVTTPSVRVPALRELDRLLLAAGAGERRCVLQAQHLSPPDPGGACATREDTATTRPVGTVPGTAHDATVAGLSTRDPRADAASAGATPTTAPPCAAPGAGGAR
jgi:hypothetical protein